MKTDIKHVLRLFPFVWALLTVYGCTDGFLDRAPTSDLSEEETFSDLTLARQYQLSLYQTLRGGLWEFNRNEFDEGWGYDQISNMDDHVMGSKADNSTFDLITGGWQKWDENHGWGNSLAVACKWKYTYNAIRAINIFLENYHKVPLANADEQLEMRHMVGEAYFLRAHHYLELVQRWGRVPLVTKVFSPTDDARIPRSDFNECIKQIVSDCDEAASRLDTHVAAEWLGRATKGAALGVKARALLWAASPYWAKHGSIYTWEQAAKAAYDVINLNVYSLYQGKYRDIFLEVFNSEVIYCKNTAPKMMWDLYLRAPSAAGGDTYGNWQATQEFVDCFEIKNPATGQYEPFDRNNPDHMANMYNKDRRDPRFSAMVLYNGSTWQGVTCDYYKGGRWGYQENATGLLKGSYYTGYNLVKYWDEQVLLTTMNGVPRQGNPHINWIYLRYADILLMYAEAQNHVGGPNSSAGDADKTALWALNEVRKRGGISELPGSISPEAFDERLRNERSVELVMEDQRFFDVRRWDIGEVLARDLHGVMATKNSDGTFTYDFTWPAGPERKKYDNHDQYILYPIHLEELKRNPNMDQNPGWADIYREN